MIKSITLFILLLQVLRKIPSLQCRRLLRKSRLNERTIASALKATLIKIFKLSPRSCLARPKTAKCEIETSLRMSDQMKQVKLMHLHLPKEKFISKRFTLSIFPSPSGKTLRKNQDLLKVIRPAPKKRCRRPLIASQKHIRHLLVVVLAVQPLQELLVTICPPLTCPTQMP